jgi:hypothetical protein
VRVLSAHPEGEPGGHNRAGATAKSSGSGVEPLELDAGELHGELGRFSGVEIEGGSRDHRVREGQADQGDHQVDDEHEFLPGVKRRPACLTASSSSVAFAVAGGSMKESCFLVDIRHARSCLKM